MKIPFIPLATLALACASASPALAQGEAPSAAPGLKPSSPASVEPLAAAGLVLEHSALGLGVSAMVADTPAQALGLRPEDRLLYLNGRKTDTSADALDALIAWPPQTRLSAVVERQIGIESLNSALPARRLPGARSASALTLNEERLRDGVLASVDRDIPDRVSRLRTPLFRIASGEKVWIRFPKGIPAGVAAGDVLEGLTSTAMATDAKLDFVAIPAGSQVWAQALSVSEKDSVKLVKLHVYKIRLKGGHTYPCSGILSEASGDQTLLKVSPGGTLVAAPAEGDPFVVDPSRSLQVWFLQPLSIHEADSFYMAGPGLWFKTLSSGQRHSFEITHVIPRRSAEAAGLKVGDTVEAVAGTPAYKLSFPEAIDKIYGPGGSEIRLKVRRRSGANSEEDVTLLRGALYRKGVGLGFGRREDGAVVVARVYSRSSAEKAGLREGDVLLSIGNADLRQLDERRITELLKTDLTGDKELTFQTPGKEPRKASIPVGSFPGLIKVEAALSQASREN